MSLTHSVFLTIELCTKEKYILLVKYKNLSRRNAFEGTVAPDFVVGDFCIRLFVWAPVDTC
jgi:hypothetical protein